VKQPQLTKVLRQAMTDLGLSGGEGGVGGAGREVLD
jgi:hypothetical protein